MTLHILKIWGFFIYKNNPSFDLTKLNSEIVYVEKSIEKMSIGLRIAKVIN